MRVVIPPLRKRTVAGALYRRPDEVERIISEVSGLSFEEFIQHAKQTNRKHPNYLPSEVLVHKIRSKNNNISDREFEAIYELLYERIARSCPKVTVHVDRSTGEDSRLMEIREFVIERFVTLVLRDRSKYEERLDIFEIRFDRAVKSLRQDAHRKMSRQENPLTTLEYDESGNVPSEVEESLSFLNPHMRTPEQEITFRFEVRQAIDSLPDEERIVIDMLVAEIPIESKNPEEHSIAELLGCTPRTVRNRRNRAVHKIQKALGLEKHDVD